MLAMQYRFTLPADYDMAIVRRRIADFGHRLDACPQLIVKAYLYAQRSEGSATARRARHQPVVRQAPFDGEKR
ncbi:Uncharacterised protein [Serratia marcescens]|nr:Uncharacterised protein [Serratia marcescens]CAI0843377.1 Uncharacterised protein [Serratia marcescens]